MIEPYPFATKSWDDVVPALQDREFKLRIAADGTLYDLRFAHHLARDLSLQKLACSTSKGAKAWQIPGPMPAEIFAGSDVELARSLLARRDVKAGDVVTIIVRNQMGAGRQVFGALFVESKPPTRRR